MNRFFLCLSFTCLIPSLLGLAEVSAEGGAELPFDPERIRRLSLDGVPRSLSIRQGETTWLGYDLERAAVMKIWRAPEGKSGLVVSGFTTRSAGETLHPGAGKEVWRWRRGGELVSPGVRYLGCSQRDGHFLLSWELRHGDSILTLREKVAYEGDGENVVRELAVEGLEEGDELLAPGVGKGWSPDKTLISGSGWHRFVLRG